jgi:uncharacterized protein GlcG (DUF336 family)
MPINIINISYKEAAAIVAGIIEKASEDGGKPVAAAVVDYAGRLLAFAAMDHVMPASIKLVQSKAYSAVIGQRDTRQWALTKKNPEYVDFDMRNWTDDNFTGFTGGVTIVFNNLVIGAVAVSGRKGKKDTNDMLMQDNELAEYGRAVLKTGNEEDKLRDEKIIMDN